MEDKIKEYEVVIGIEAHAELSTKTKIYCNCSTEYGADPNTHCCPICTGMPGVLPVLNEKVVEYAVKMGLATDCSIAKFSKQDRKNYFYPDLPKAFQTSQFDLPLCTNGHVDIFVNGAQKTIGITRIHIEEDAGKLIHDEFTGSTLVDMNRCAVPLIEIVSEPDIRNAAEAIEYMQTLKGILEYLEVCDCKMQEGSLRCDVNLSVRKHGDSKLGTRTETKNLNSFKAIQKSIEFEIRRQIEELENGGTIYQETRRFDDNLGTGYAMRTKEDAHDYRYFEEPDLAPIVLSDEYVSNIKNNLPEMPNVRRARYIEQYMLSEYDASQITNSKRLANYFDKTVSLCNNPKAVTNWIMGDFFKMLNELGLKINESKIIEQNLANLIKLIDTNVISSAMAKKVFVEMFETGKDAKAIVEEKGLVQITDESAILKIVEEVVNSNDQSVSDYLAGKDKAIGFLVGQIMKLSKGKANPTTVNELLIKVLGAKK
ncbi:MAG: Asp-tRNA(Asn)/Glu-tRNA(Gln) amidotransferase subunit GatB [Clostridia bacterium]|nr:Asp-tRNA(Asn)/Glu-tRNA(Gln) amidotransferase subunit GatB [Clostridia bacterium]MDD4386796.1 Asp-tRNA(Asn)/Glu-tRNA(Gln) amidotransferase subunit GatB [Clostridia bacterium]